MKKNLHAHSHDPYFNTYIDLVKEDDLKAAFLAQQPVIDDYFCTITEEQSMYAYADGKWTIKEMLVHIIDCERIFAYRALCIARGENQPLPGFDENAYAESSRANDRTWKNIIAELKAVRKSTLFLVSSLPEAPLSIPGTASGKTLTALAALFIIPGHLYHHVQVIKDRYLLAITSPQIK